MNDNEPIIYGQRKTKTRCEVEDELVSFAGLWRNGSKSPSREGSEMKRHLICRSACWRRWAARTRRRTSRVSCNAASKSTRTCRAGRDRSHTSAATYRQRPPDTRVDRRAAAGRSAAHKWLSMYSIERHWGRSNEWRSDSERRSAHEEESAAQRTSSGMLGAAAPTWIASYGASSGKPLRPSPHTRRKRALSKPAPTSAEPRACGCGPEALQLGLRFWVWVAAAAVLAEERALALEPWSNAASLGSLFKFATDSSTSSGMWSMPTTRPVSPTCEYGHMNVWSNE